MALKASAIIEQLDKVSSEINYLRQRLTDARAIALKSYTDLQAIPTKYAEVVAIVSAAGYGTDAHQAAQKAELAALTSEFQALQMDAGKLQTWTVANIVEF